MKKLLCCLGIVVIAFGISTTALSAETQLTFNEDTNYALDNNLNFSPDGEWLCYDTRPFEGGLGNCLTIEKVNIATKDTVVIHETFEPIIDVGPGVSAVSYFPEGDKVVAIHGLPTPLEYEQYRRFGAIFSPTDGSADIVVADARDVTAPFTPGALRGGSHRHEPSGDGQWIGFTYNDMIMYDLGNNLRTIGVTKLGEPVEVDEGVENQNGIGFTALVVKVTPKADIVADSGDIYKASDDSWVGEGGYDLGDGTMQRARAFIGRTMVTGAGGGDPVERREVYVVDIPEDITVPGPDGPLEGTATTFPMPPLGTVQRRLTFSDENCYGIVRSSKDGSRLAFQHAGQIHLISPLGGATTQATSLPGGASKPWWHPSGDYLISRSAGSIWATNVIEGDPDFGYSWMLTEPTDASPDAMVFSNDGSLIGFNRATGPEVTISDGRIKRAKQIYVAGFFVPEPSSMALVGIGALAMLLAGRRRRSS